MGYQINNVCYATAQDAFASWKGTFASQKYYSPGQNGYTYTYSIVNPTVTDSGLIHYSQHTETLYSGQTYSYDSSQEIQLNACNDLLFSTAPLGVQLLLIFAVVVCITGFLAGTNLMNTGTSGAIGSD